MENRVVLTACITESEALRYTPSGLPAITLRIEHESQQVEAGHTREVKAHMKALAFGAIAERLARQTVGSSWTFTGFLATPRNGKHALLHVLDIQQN